MGDFTTRDYVLSEIARGETPQSLFARTGIAVEKIEWILREHQEELAAIKKAKDDPA